MTIKLYNEDNMKFETSDKVDLVYCDMIYENNTDFSWVIKYWDILKISGLFIVQTDHHSIFEIGSYLKRIVGSYFVNHIVWRCEWGNFPKDRFRQNFDDILIFSKGLDFKFYPERAQVSKATLTKGLNPSGRTTKLATTWIDTCVLTTTAKERVKKNDGHLIRWQKPLSLFDYIMFPFTDENDIIVDPFMGSGSLAEWSKINNRQYVGIENDKEVFELAKKRIDNI
jgi:DNA modification methylase